jgi:uncharacterized protein
MEEEVKMEGLVRHYEPFTRFLQVMSFSHASLLNVSNIARECYVKRTTVQDWIALLEDMLMCYQVPLFTQRAQRQLSAHAKFYLFDTGVYHALRPEYLKDTHQEMDDAGLEGLVAQHLRAWKDYTAEQHEIAFWRTRSGVEVDFVVFGELGFWAIEVKNAKKIRPEDIHGLSEFIKDYPEAKAFLLYRGKERLLKHNILCLPCEDFLRALYPGRPFSA